MNSHRNLSILLRYCALERYEAVTVMSLADALDEFNFAATCMWQTTADANNGISENLKGIVCNTVHSEVT